MKIVVVNYDELNQLKSCDEIIADICLFYADASESANEELGSVLRGRLDELTASKEAEVSIVDVSDAINRAYLSDTLKAMEIDLLVTYNLAGFELCTLTDGLAYNLVDCRQLHIIEKSGIPGEKYLNKEKSINMFLWDRR